MKKLLLSAVALLGSIAALAADDALNLTMKDGTTHSFVLVQKPVITMGEGNLYVSTDNATATYRLHEVSHYAFGDAATGISAATAAATGVVRQGDNIVLGGVSADRVVVSSIGGAAVAAAVSTVDNATVVSLASLPSGVYIIKVGGTTVKVNKK